MAYGFWASAPRTLCDGTACRQPQWRTLAFGPDGMLYFAMGDGGRREDPEGHSQNLSSWLGKMHRLDVDHAEPGMAYGIPPTIRMRSSQDPHLRREIFAAGLREPWRFSFDRLTGDCWVGDVGQGKYEEVTVVGRGENHGWNVYEGFEPFSEQYRQPDHRYTWPVFVYDRRLGNSITGGYVYRGDVHSGLLRGLYLWGLHHASSLGFVVRRRSPAEGNSNRSGSFAGGLLCRSTRRESLPRGVRWKALLSGLAVRLS